MTIFPNQWENQQQQPRATGLRPSYKNTLEIIPSKLNKTQELPIMTQTSNPTNTSKTSWVLFPWVLSENQAILIEGHRPYKTCFSFYICKIRLTVPASLKNALHFCRSKQHGATLILDLCLQKSNITHSFKYCSWAKSFQPRALRKLNWKRGKCQLAASWKSIVNETCKSSSCISKE